MARWNQIQLLVRQRIEVIISRYTPKSEVDALVDQGYVLHDEDDRLLYFLKAPT